MNSNSLSGAVGLDRSIPQPDPILYVPDVAERLRITEKACRWLVYTKQLPPHITIGNRLAWKASQIEAYLDAKFAEAEAQANPINQPA